jgi:hypothetical protein
MSPNLLTKNIIASTLVDYCNQTIGVHETSFNDGPLIQEFQKTVDGVASKEPWCMGWVQTMVHRTCQDFAIVNPLFPSEHCLTVWFRTDARYKKKEPSYGYVAIFSTGGAINGHTGVCITGLNGTFFGTIEGNTNEGGSREGNAVVQKVRTFPGKYGMQVVGFIDVPQMILDLLERHNVKQLNQKESLK